MPRPAKPQAERLLKRSVTMTDGRYQLCLDAVEALGKRLGLRLQFAPWAGEVLAREAEKILRESEAKPPDDSGRR